MIVRVKDVVRVFGIWAHPQRVVPQPNITAVACDRQCHGSNTAWPTARGIAACSGGDTRSGWCPPVIMIGCYIAPVMLLPNLRVGPTLPPKGRARLPGSVPAATQTPRGWGVAEEGDPLCPCLCACICVCACMHV